MTAPEYPLGEKRVGGQMPRRIEVYGELMDAVWNWYDAISADDNEVAIVRLVDACAKYEREVGR